MAELEDDDDFPNEFDGLNFDNIPELQAPAISGMAPISASTDIVPTVAASPAQSSGSNIVEDIDSNFIAALDALEARALSKMRQDDDPTESQSALSFGLIVERLNLSQPPNIAVDSPKGEDASSLISGIKCQPSKSSYTNCKGKRKAEEEIDVRAMLSGYEVELTCPICCDLLVGAHVANPCGHTCCGKCGYEWLTQNKYVPTCAICRSSLSPRKPLLPNFTVDGFVRQHLQTLAKSGCPEWQQKGYKTIEWNKRLQSWKEQANARAEKEKLKESPRPRRRLPRYHEEDDDFVYEPWPEWVDLNVQPARILPRRGTRTRR